MKYKCYSIMSNENNTTVNRWKQHAWKWIHLMLFYKKCGDVALWHIHMALPHCIIINILHILCDISKSIILQLSLNVIIQPEWSYYLLFLAQRMKIRHHEHQLMSVLLFLYYGRLKTKCYFRSFCLCKKLWHFFGNNESKKCPMQNH